MKSNTVSAVGAPGVVRLAALTPLRDVVRLRLSGRLDIERPIAAAGLPAATAELVRCVVRQTRLWRLETVEIARELAGHFADGLAAGASADELVERFGDTRTAARLIARAARRKRPAAVKVAVRAVQAMGLLLVTLLAVYGLLAVQHYGGRSTVARNFTAELNAPVLAIPVEQRAWPKYRAAAAALGRVGTTENLIRARPDEPRWPRVAEFLRVHAAAIGAVRDAAAILHLGAPLSDHFDPALYPEMNQGGFVPNPNPELMQIILPNLSEMRRLSRILIADMWLAASEGDGERAAADVMAVMAMVDHIGEQGMFMTDYTALAMLSHGTEELARVLYDYPDLLSEGQMVTLAHRASACAGGGRLKIRLDSERLTFEDILQRTFTDDGRGDGRPTAAGVRRLNSLAGGSESIDVHRLHRFINPVAAVLVADRKDQREMFERMMAAAEARAARPLWEWGEAYQIDVEDEIVGSSWRDAGPRYFPAHVLFPGADRAAMSAELITQRRDAALVALALTVHRRRTGGYPATLEALAPGLLPSVPKDRFDGGPIKYRLKDGRPVLYSVGVDRKDDGGRPPESNGELPDRSAIWLSSATVAAKLAGPNAGRYDGDWVLWPSAAPALPSETNED